MKSWSVYFEDDSLPLVLTAQTADEAKAEAQRFRPGCLIRCVICNGDVGDRPTLA